MSASSYLLIGSLLLSLTVSAPQALGQKPVSQSADSKDKRVQSAPSEEREILKEIKEAYKAPFEVHEDVLKELRRSYQQPTPEREAKILKELRRLYQLTTDRESAILQEIRRAYAQPSAEQEQRIFGEISRADRLPEGAVPVTVQADQARKIFRKLDGNGDGLLGGDEMTDSLRSELVRWDVSRDGLVDAVEYWAYYQSRLRTLSDQVASGAIDLNLKRGGPKVALPSLPPLTAPVEEEAPRPVVYRAGKLPPGLPDWFVKVDADSDGQIGLYEWRKSGRPLREFFLMDRNGDGFVTLDELNRYLAQQLGERQDKPVVPGPGQDDKPSKEQS